MYKHTNSKGVDYFLHMRLIPMRNGKRKIYFFAKSYRELEAADLPAQYQVVEGVNGLPLIKKA